MTAFYLLPQNTPTQNQVDGSLQSELIPVHTSSPQTPPTELIAQPPSTVDTAALSEDPLPGEGICTELLLCGDVRESSREKVRRVFQ